jgi:DNA-binding MarR family transcriptional regulator
MATRSVAPPAEASDLRSIMEVWGRQQAVLAAETSRFFADLDLTMAQFRALAMIRRGGTMTGKDLAGRLSVTPGTLVPLIDRLEELGYLRRVPDLKDRRVTWLELTTKGERLFWQLFRAGGQRIMAAIAKLRPVDRREFRRILTQIADNL